MNNDDIQHLLKGEQTDVHFKERQTDNYDIGCEIVAFCNSRGGKHVFGVVDKTGALNPLSYTEVQETNNRLTSIATDNVIPNVLIDVEVVEVDDGAHLEFKDDTRLHEFIITITRNVDPDTGNPDLDTKTGDLVTDLDTQHADLDTDLVTHKCVSAFKFTKKQQDIINSCSVPCSSKEILERLGLSNHTKNREKHIMSLVKV